jgi:hypothetical protein
MHCSTLKTTKIKTMQQTDPWKVLENISTKLDSKNKHSGSLLCGRRKDGSSDHKLGIPSAYAKQQPGRNSSEQRRTLGGTKRSPHHFALHFRQIFGKENEAGARITRTYSSDEAIGQAMKG